MNAICLNCETSFVRHGPYFTCEKCKGPCDTFRYNDLSLDASAGVSEYPSNQYTENQRHKPGEKSQKTRHNYEQLFRHEVPKPTLSKSQSLKRFETTDKFRLISFRFVRFCSRYSDPYTWLEMLRDSKTTYDAKAKDKNSKTK